MFPVRHGCICCVASREGLRGSSPPMVSVPRTSYPSSLFIRVFEWHLSPLLLETIHIANARRVATPFFRVGTLHDNLSSLLKPRQCCFHGLLGFAACHQCDVRLTFCFDVFMYGYTSSIRLIKHRYGPSVVLRLSCCELSIVNPDGNLLSPFAFPVSTRTGFVGDRRLGDGCSPLRG